MCKNSLVFKMMIAALICKILFTGCGGSGSRTPDSMVKDNDSIIELNIIHIKLDPLKNETLRLKGRDPFGEIIELKGKHITNNSLILSPKEIEMVIKDNFMVLKSIGSKDLFMLLSLPDLLLIKSFGSFGPGPEEFMFPGLCRNTQPDVLATVVDVSGKIFDVLPEGRLRASKIRMPNSGSRFGAGEYPALMTDTLLYYAANSSTGKSVFIAGGTDSLQVNEIQDLALDPRRKGWANYIGDFAINTEQTRMVYAYKYFKIVRFFDLEHNTIRTINFEREEFDESTTYRVDGLDANVTHYWGICAGEKYVYMLYSGRTPAQVWNDNRKENFYIFVEKYDWNGNPIAKYKLDQWGYFTVDEKNNILYLLSTNDDDPFFIYQL